MVRLYENTAVRLLGLLLYLKNRVETADEAAAKGFLECMEAGEEEDKKTFQTVVNVENGYLKEGTEDIEDIIYALVDQLQLGNNSTSDKDLIDTIVSSVNLPYGSTRYGETTYSALVRAILLPSEVELLKASIQGKEMSCSKCRTKFDSMELGTIMVTNDGLPQFCCPNCIYPERIKCKCGKSVPLSEDTWNKIARSRVCDDCATGEGRAVARRPVMTFGRWAPDRLRAGVNPAGIDNVPIRRRFEMPERAPRARTIRYEDLVAPAGLPDPVPEPAPDPAMAIHDEQLAALENMGGILDDPR